MLHIVLLFLSGLALAEEIDPRVGEPANCGLREKDRPPEEPYNGIDDDCDPDTQDDDLDHDGLLKAEDCNDRELEDAQVVDGPVTWRPDPQCDGDRPILVRGDLEVDVDTQTLIGLSCVCAVTGTLDITGNHKIVNLDGLDHLRWIGGDLKIVNTKALASTRGLPELEEISGDLKIQGNTALTYIEGFEELRHVGGDILITQNPELYTIEGFDKLETVDGNLTISKNDKLVRIHAMKLLAQVGGTTKLEGNANLDDVQGLEQVTDLSKLFPERLAPEEEKSLRTTIWALLGPRTSGSGGLNLTVGMLLLVLLTAPMLIKVLFDREDPRVKAARKAKQEQEKERKRRASMVPGADQVDGVVFDPEQLEAARDYPGGLAVLDPDMRATAGLVEETYQYGDHLAYASTSDSHAIWVLDGDAVVEISGNQIGQVRDGMIIGSAGLFEEAPRSVDIRAVEETRTLRIDPEAYTRLVEANHPAAVTIERVALATQAWMLRALHDTSAAQALGTRNLPPRENPRTAAQLLDKTVEQLTPGEPGEGPVDAASLFEQVPAFSGVAPEYIQELASQFGMELFEPGEILFRQGTGPGKILLVSSGVAELVGVFQGQRGVTTMGTMGPGDLFGANALFTNTARECSAVVTSRMTAVVIDAEAAGNLLGMDHDMARQVRVAFIRALAAARRAALHQLTEGEWVGQAVMTAPLRGSAGGGS